MEVGFSVFPPGDMQVYTTDGAGAAGATAGVVGAAGAAGATAVAAGAAGFLVFVGAGALLVFAGAAGAVGAIVAAGVTESVFPVVVGRAGVAALGSRVVCSIGTAFASTVFATNSAC